MNTYIALFRGINIGGHHLLPMNGLAEILHDSGYVNIKTYIQSGNVVFQSKNKLPDNAATEISRKISDTYGFEPTVLLLDEIALQDAINNNPLDTSDGKAVHFFFLDIHPKAPDLARLTELKSKSEQFKLIGTIFIYSPLRESAAQNWPQISRNAWESLQRPGIGIR